MDKPKNLYARPMDIREGIAGRNGGPGRGGGAKGENWDNCDSKINKIYSNIVISATVFKSPL